MQSGSVSVKGTYAKIAMAASSEKMCAASRDFHGALQAERTNHLSSLNKQLVMVK